MDRRFFLKLTGLGCAGGAVLSGKTRVLSSARKAAPRGSARNLIFISLQGAPSHVDTFDLKLGSWTPDDFEPTTNGNIQLPSGLFPNLIQQADKFSLLRCLSGIEAVHQRAQYVLETAHTFNPTFSKEQPHMGSLLAYELESSRRESDVLPGFLSINGLVQGSGMLASRYAPFVFSSAEGIQGLEHPGGQDLFRKRYDSLMAVDPNRSELAAQGSAISGYHDFYDLGQGIMYNETIVQATNFTDSEMERYGASGTGGACAIAVKLLAADLGTRVVNIVMGGWDHHFDIYDRNIAGGLYDRAGELDPALAAMLADLAAQPGTRGGTLLDETLVIVGGEFGRTPGPISNNLGRDHYPYVTPALVAGGGIIPNQNFGITDDQGWGISDQFWSQDRYMAMEDLIATAYSSLGVDWTKEILDTPSGRVYEYTPKVNGVAGYYTDIVEMFGG